MTLRVRVAPEAQAELDEAVRWYEQRNAGVGLALLNGLNNVLEAISRWPHAGTPVANLRTQRIVRRRSVRRFPYHVVWTVTDGEIYVVAIAHNRRQPGYWSQRIKNL